MNTSQSHESREDVAIKCEWNFEITENAEARKNAVRARARAGSPASVRRRCDEGLNEIQAALEVRAQREFPFRLNVLAWPAADADGGKRAVLPVRFAPGQTVTSRGHADEHGGWQRTACIRSLDPDTDRRLREAELVRALLAEFGERIDWFRPGGVVRSTFSAQDHETRALLAIEDLVRPGQRFTWERGGELIRNLEVAREVRVHQCAVYPDLIRAALRAIQVVRNADLLVGEAQEPPGGTAAAETLAMLRAARGSFVTGLSGQTVARLRERGWSIESASIARRKGRDVPPDAKGYRLLEH